MWSTAIDVQPSTTNESEDVPATPQEVRDLVARYDRERQVLQSPAYGEADTRKEFVEPLFAALGWDVLNTRRYAEAYKDVVNEYSLKIGDSHKAPDYAFRVGGTRKFFVEAKRPSADIVSDGRPAYQLRRYGWTAKLAVSVLTNFRHLAVYDCTFKPSIDDTASTARTLTVPWDRLVVRWLEVAELLAKDSVYQGSLDRYATNAARRRGTTTVDDAFLVQMEKWREALAKGIANDNKTLSVAELNEAVQQIVDRLIFLRIAEDRGIETYGRLRDQLEGQGVYERLVLLFQDADRRYNSGLFHFRDEPSISGSPDKLTPHIDVGDRVLRSIIGAMYFPASPYEFSVLPADILGQVYEQFLGKVIRLTPTHQARIEEKPEVRKAGGVYYTPSHVVEHIVEETLRPQFEGKSVRAGFNVKILDPACGSGSFLIGALDWLIRWFSNTYKDLGPEARNAAMVVDRNGEWRLSLRERKRILTSCLFGVDIDAQAVEVTKLSLMLKVLEGENSETINNQMKMFHVDRVLPDLNTNIVCGNSLVSSDAVHHLQLSSDDEAQLNPFDWQYAFPRIADKGGFHAVIGNPPYDVLEKDRGAASWPHALLREYLDYDGEYAPALGGKLNLYRLFLIRSLDLVRPDGGLGMIVPMSFAADISTVSTRRHLLSSLRDARVDLFPQKDDRLNRIFLRAKLSTAIVVGKKRKSQSTRSIVQARVFPRNRFDDDAIAGSVSINDCELIDPVTSPIPLADDDEVELLKRIHSRGDVERLDNLSESFRVTRGEINQTVFRKYISTVQAGCERMLKGVEIGPFELRVDLSQGEREWLDASSLRAHYPQKGMIRSPRIAVQRITGVDERLRIIATIVRSPMWFADSTNSIAAGPKPQMTLEYLAALLNSDLMQWRFRVTSTNNNVGTNELKALPIRVPDRNTRSDADAARALEEGATRAIKLKDELSEVRSAAHADRSLRAFEATMRRLNVITNELYGLDQSDVGLVRSRLDRKLEYGP